MASEQLAIGLKSMLQKIASLRLFGLIGLLVITQLSYASANITEVKDSSARSSTKTGKMLPASNPYSLSAANVEVGLDQSAQSDDTQTTIVPKINVVSLPPFWANSSVVVMKISLEVVRGNQILSYKQHPKIILILGPNNASFNSNTVEIPAGTDHSDPFTLTSSQPTTIEVTCTPDSGYSGPVITQPQSVKMEFLALIDRVGIEPVSGVSTINIGARFRVYLCNHNDVKTHQVPKRPVTVQLTSQSENGTFDEKKVDLTEQQFSRDVRYVGTRMGYDTIVALAHYQNNELNGQSDRVITFPWLTFIAGLLGTLVGALLRTRIGEPDKRLKNFLESSVCGLIFCLIVILFPVGTKLPQISTFIQPALEFVLALLVSFLPELFKGLLSFLPSKS